MGGVCEGSATPEPPPVAVVAEWPLAVPRTEIDLE